jgi:ABC-2 type transport system ATP-binding protein
VPDSPRIDVPASARAGTSPGVSVQVRGVTHRYGRHLALDDVDVDVRKGRITCLVGPNGAGKSTFMHGVVGLHKPQVGAIIIGDHPAGSRRAAAEIGFVYDDLPLPDNLTGAEALGLLARTHSRWDAACIAELLDLFGLLPAAGRLIAEYSHGMKRKLQLVASLGHRPSVWVLDEPLSGLDPLAAHTATALIRHFRSAGGTVLIATHDLRSVADLADDVIILADGRVASARTLGDLVPPGHTLADVYLDLTGLRPSADRADVVLAGIDVSSPISSSTVPSDLER